MVCDWTTGGMLDRSQPHPPLSPMPANRPASAVLGQVSREAPDIQSLKQRWSPESPHQRGRWINTGINYNSSLRPSTPWLVTSYPDYVSRCSCALWSPVAGYCHREILSLLADHTFHSHENKSATQKSSHFRPLPFCDYAPASPRPCS